MKNFFLFAIPFDDYAWARLQLINFGDNSFCEDNLSGEWLMFVTQRFYWTVHKNHSEINFISFSFSWNPKWLSTHSMFWIYETGFYSFISINVTRIWVANQKSLNWKYIYILFECLTCCLTLFDFKKKKSLFCNILSSINIYFECFFFTLVTMRMHKKCDLFNNMTYVYLYLQQVISSLFSKIFPVLFLFFFFLFIIENRVNFNQ